MNEAKRKKKRVCSLCYLIAKLLEDFRKHKTLNFNLPIELRTKDWTLVNLGH